MLRLGSLLQQSLQVWTDAVKTSREEVARKGLERGQAHPEKMVIVSNSLVYI